MMFSVKKGNQHARNTPAHSSLIDLEPVHSAHMKRSIMIAIEIRVPVLAPFIFSLASSLSVSFPGRMLACIAYRAVCFYPTGVVGLSVCVCVCVCARARVRMRVRVCVCDELRPMTVCSAKSHI